MKDFESMTIRNNSGNRKAIIIFSLLVFAAMAVFFVIAHPVPVFDMDDWTHIYQIHSALPTWGTHNPSKIFPEVFMGLVSYLGAYTVYPVWKDYFGVMALVHGLFIALFIAAYTAGFVLLIRDRYRKSAAEAILFGTVFLVLHFLAFRIDDHRNEHLLYSGNLTCYYNYTLPALLNAMVVMYISRCRLRAKNSMDSKARCLSNAENMALNSILRGGALPRSILCRILQSVQQCYPYGLLRSTSSCRTCKDHQREEFSFKNLCQK